LVAGGCGFILISVLGKMAQTVIMSGHIAIVGRPNVGKSAVGFYPMANDRPGH